MQIEFNVAKCEVIRITTKKTPIIFQYQIHQTTLKATKQSKYLGVTITPDLLWKWQHHPKANSTLAFLNRNIRPSPPEAKTKSYNTYVRPSVEYTSSAWPPDIDQLEMVQRRTARFVRNDYLRQSSVTEMVTLLYSTTLQKRRDMTRVTMLYKIKHDHTRSPAL